MAIARKAEPFIPEQAYGAEAVEEEVIDEDIYSQTEFGEDEEYQDLSQVPFEDNLAENIDEEKLAECAGHLLEAFEADLTSRKDWEEAYVDGLEYLGMNVEDRDDPFSGACGVYHPILTEAIVRFQSQAILEIFPASGPVRTKILGRRGAKDPNKEKQAIRVEEEMNYLLTEKMPEYRSETEQLLFRLPLSGSVLRKVYYDPTEDRPCALMVPVEDFVISYGASDFKTTERYTHRMKRTENELKKLMASGFYREVEIGEPMAEYSNIEEAHDSIKGQKPSVEQDNRHTILEMHVDYDFGEDENEIALPYIITIEKSSKTILAIRRNWMQDDPHRRKRIHFAHYQYMPGMGFYGMGLVHLIGGLAKSATSILRQLVDAGTLANLPSGFKTKGLRIKGEDEPIEPGEWRDADVAAGTLKENIFPLPTKEPSATLYQLLQTIVDEARRIGSIADIEIGNMNQEAPVGTTFALLERSLKVMSAVHARLHAALKDELRLISSIVGTYMSEKYDYDDESEFDRRADFSAKVDIIPVSDPNAATMAQRIVQYQAVWQLAQANPDIYNMPVLNRTMLEVMQVKDAEMLVPLPNDMRPMDPISENMAFITGEPVKVFEYQDHEAHIQAHMAALNDPQIAQMIGQSPKAEMIRNIGEAHIAEHLAHQYRKQIEEELGTALPPLGEPLPPEVEVKLSRLVADAANRLFYKNKDAAAIQKNQELLQDPLVQIQMREQELAEAEFEHKKKMDEANLEEKRLTREDRTSMETIKAGVDLAVAEDDRLSEEAIKVAQIGADLKKSAQQSRNQSKE